MKKQMKIHLITLAAFPFTSAESIHLAMFSKAMAEICDFTLVTAKKLWRPITFFKNIEHQYGIKNDTFKQNKYLQVTPKNNYFLKKSLSQAKKESAIVYARQGVVARHARIMQLSTIWEIHSLPNSNDLIFIAEELGNNFLKKIVVISHALKTDIIKKATLSLEQANNIIVAPDAADDSKFKASPLNTKKPKIGYVGSSFKGKGIEIVVPLAKLLPEITFEIYGVNEDDKLLTEFRPLPDNITWHGKIPYAQIPKAMESFEIALLPNQPNIYMADGTDIGQYTSPMKLFEYMACGKAIIASDLDILKEVLVHNKNALLVPHNDIQAWKEAVEILKNDNEFFSNLTCNAKEDFMNNYTYHARAKNIVMEIHAEINQIEK